MAPTHRSTARRAASSTASSCCRSTTRGAARTSASGRTGAWSPCRQPRAELRQRLGKPRTPKSARQLAEGSDERPAGLVGRSTPAIRKLADDVLYWVAVVLGVAVADTSRCEAGWVSRRLDQLAWRSTAPHPGRRRTAADGYPLRAAHRPRGSGALQRRRHLHDARHCHPKGFAERPKVPSGAGILRSAPERIRTSDLRFRRPQVRTLDLALESQI
jgi:hypothetical protein